MNTRINIAICALAAIFVLGASQAFGAMEKPMENVTVTFGSCSFDKHWEQVAYSCNVPKDVPVYFNRETDKYYDYFTDVANSKPVTVTFGRSWDVNWEQVR